MMDKILSFGFYFIFTVGYIFESCMNIEYDIPDEIYEMCPYADICHRKATLQPPEGYTSCCQSCSCEEDCGLTMNCCFDHLDKYRRVEKGEVSCIKPTIGIKILSRYYYMISSCNLINEVLQKENTSACQLQDENGTNLLAPVSSAKDVYVNAQCAECNNDFNYKSWDYVLHGEQSINEHIRWSFEHNNIGKSGTIEYIPPRSDKLFAPKLCYQPDMSPYCSDDEVLLFPSTCKNLQSLFVPDYETTIYKNAACLLCNSSSLHDVRRQFCAKTNKFSSPGTITVLIDSQILNAADFNKVFKPDTDASYTKTCMSGSIKSLLTGRCLSLHCPEGLIRTKSGCKYLIKRWYADAITMQLKLSADDRSLPSQYISNPNIWMKPPCPGMKLVKIYYEHGNLTHVNSFILKEIYNGRGFSPSQMYPHLRSCLEKPWTVSIKSITYTFKAKLDRHAGYIQDGIQELHYVSDPRMTHNTLPKVYEKILDYIFTFNKYRAKVVSRKTFFCNQIRLPEEEVELGYGEIRILANNKTLGTNEFAYSGVNQNISPNFTCFVCLEDYIPQNGAPSSTTFARYWFITGNLVLLCTQFMSSLG